MFSFPSIEYDRLPRLSESSYAAGCTSVRPRKGRAGEIEGPLRSATVSDSCEAPI